MEFQYARLDAIIKRLAGRITVVNINDYGITGVTGTQVGTDLIFIVGEPIEEMITIYLSMLYVFPLQNSHPYISNIAEKLIVADVYGSYFPSQMEDNSNTSNFASVLRQQALNEFQVLFDGTGIFVPGATNQSQSLQNDENRQQQIVKTLILPGEVLKPLIGYDFNGDGLSDTDLFKMNTNVSPSFYNAGDLKQVTDPNEPPVFKGVRTRPWLRPIYPNHADVDFFQSLF